jgi:hypothetical protein
VAPVENPDERNIYILFNNLVVRPRIWTDPDESDKNNIFRPIQIHPETLPDR